MHAHTHAHTQIIANLQDPKAGRQLAKKQTKTDTNKHSRMHTHTHTHTHKSLQTYKTRKQVAS